jgi:hypothetical protein
VLATIAKNLVRQSLLQCGKACFNYKAAYCMAACPAGEDVIPPFLSDRQGFVREVVKPLQDKTETIYVAKASNQGQRFY